MSEQPEHPENGRSPLADAKKTIRVIESRRNLVDITTTAPEELALVVSTVETLVGDKVGKLGAILDLAAFLRGRLAPFLTEGPGSAPNVGEGDTLVAIRARDLLLNPAIRPIIGARGAEAVAELTAASSNAGERLRTRPSIRVRAISPDGFDIAVAAEEPIEIIGFAIDPKSIGSIMLASGVTHAPFIGLDALVSCGSYSAAIVAAVSRFQPSLTTINSDGDANSKIRRGDPSNPRGLAEIKWPLLARRGFVVLPSTEEVVDGLRRATRAAVEYYLSGAAAAQILPNIAVAARGAVGAWPEYVRAIGPALANVLAAAPNAPPVGPTWRQSHDEERLRYLAERVAKTNAIIASGPDVFAYDLNLLYDLYRVGASDQYLFALTEGRESPRLEAFLEASAIRYAKLSQIEMAARESTIETSRARQYIVIIEDKFGSARVRAILDALRVATGSRARGAPGGSLAEVSDAVQVDNPSAVLQLLTKRESEIVITEFENRRLAWEASANNKCPHVRLAKRLREATSAETAATVMRDLAKYLDTPATESKRPSRQNGASQPPRPDSWLMCRNCGYRAICPHVRELVALEGRRASYDEIRTRLSKYAVRVPGLSDSYSSYCRICSERVAEIFEEDEEADTSRAGRFGNLDSGLRARIWSVALAAARNIRFATPTDERQFASVVADVIFPLLMAAEEAVAKKGRRRRAPKKTGDGDAFEDDEELDPRTHLYIILFVYAYILDLVRATKDARSQEISFIGVKVGSKEGVYAEKMLQLVAREHSGVISQIEDITADYIRARFTECYRAVRGESASSLRVANMEEELAVQITSVDPTYRYALTVARVAGDLPMKRAASPAEARREFEKLLGAPLPSIVKLARESAKDPELAPLYLRRVGVEVPSGGTIEFLVKDPRIGLYSRVYTPKPSIAGPEAIKAFVDAAGSAPVHGVPFVGGAALPRSKRADHKREREREGARSRDHGTSAKTKGVSFVHPRDSFAAAERGAFFEAYRMFVQYTVAVRSVEAFDAYRAELAEIRRSEDGLRMVRLRAAEAAHRFQDFKFEHSQQYVPTKIAIGEVYDEEGRRHRWVHENTSYYYASRSGSQGASQGATPSAPVEIKGGVEGVKAARKDGRLTSDMMVVDVGCGVCGVRKSEASKLDAEKVWHSVRATSAIDSFFVFYESRCPESGLHDWDKVESRTACRKCGLTTIIAKEVVSGNAAKNKDARAYYDKYSARFEENRAQMHEAVPIVPARDGTRDNAHDSTTPTTVTWKADYTYIVRAAELIGVSPNVMDAIGTTEGREYTKVTEGQDMPAPPTNSQDPRIYAADAEMRFFLSEYSQMRNVASIIKPATTVLELLAAAGAPKHDWFKLPDIFPAVATDYRETLSSLRAARDGEKMLSFVIQSLCRAALDIAVVKAAEDWVSRLAVAFAKQTLARVVRGQKLFAKPGIFNWTIFVMDDEEEQDQVGDVGEDVLEELLNNGSEEAPDDPFSGENMDYDTSENQPNNEPE